VAWLVDQAAARGVALEINSHYLCAEPDRWMVEACLQRGVRLAIGTDAHRWSEHGDFHYHRKLLADYGITTQAALDAVLFDHRQA
jgi:histidinol phosphatase-like PHP family hydrolase